MLPTPSPRATPIQRQGRVNQANVIKWMHALPTSGRGPDLPGQPEREAPRRRTAPCTGPAPIRPLPDPSMARLCAVPESAPPYDDEPFPKVTVMADGGQGPRQAGQRPWQAGQGPWQAGQAKPAAAAKPAEPAPPAADEAEGQRPRAVPPWPSQFAQVLAETLAGTRSSHQLTPWTTERARGHIRRLGPVLSASQQPRIRRVVASTPANGIVELTVVVNFGPRVRALAVRLERTERGTTGQSWLCTAIEAA